MNEEKSIGKVIDAVHGAMRGSGLDYEILVIDTESRDRTRDVAKERGARVVDEPRRGYGRAYKTGFSMSAGEVIATLDADSTYPAEEIPRLAKMLYAEDLEFVTTNRFGDMEEGAMSVKHRFGNWVLTAMTNLLFGVRLRDSQSGMWVFRREALERLKLTSDGMPLSEEIKIEAFRKLRSREVPIRFRRRVGEVKLSSWRDGRKNLAFLWKKRFAKG